MKINFKHLYYFYTVAKEKTITEAARKIGITQASMSQQLINFQKDIGTPLLERDGVRKKLTPAGEEVYNHCDQIFSLIDVVEKKVIRK